MLSLDTNQVHGPAVEQRSTVHIYMYMHIPFIRSSLQTQIHMVKFNAPGKPQSSTQSLTVRHLYSVHGAGAKGLGSDWGARPYVWIMRIPVLWMMKVHIIMMPRTLHTIILLPVFAARFEDMLHLVAL